MTLRHRLAAGLTAVALGALAAGCAAESGSDSPAVSTRVTEPFLQNEGPSAVATDRGTATATVDTSAGPIGKYVVTSVVGHEIVPGTTIAITFEAAELGVQAGCNAMGGAYQILVNTLVVKNLVSTMMACEEPLMEQEQWVAAFLSSAPVVSQEGETLMLTGRGTVPEAMTLARAPEMSGTSLEGTSWTMLSYTTGDATNSVPLGVEVTMTFADGRVVLDSGCNTISGPVEFAPEAITVSGMMSTRMACPEDVAEMETVITTFFDGTLSVSFDRDRLTLAGPGDPKRLEFLPATDTAVTSASPITGVTTT